MKKLLGSTLALAMMFPVGANAELLKNLKLDSELDVQATSANNITDLASAPVNIAPPNGSNNDRIGAVISRLIVTANWDLLDDVHSRVTLVHGGVNNNVNNNRAYGSNSQTVQAALETGVWLQEANVAIDKVFGAVDTRIGRQFYGEPGDLIAYFGPQDNYGLFVQSLDAFRFDWNGESFGVTGLAGTTKGGSTAINNGDTDLTALLANYKTETANLGAYIYNQTTHATGGQGANPPATNGRNDFLYIVGVKGKATFWGVTAKAELAKDLGQNRVAAGGDQAGNYDGWALLANADYKLDMTNVAVVDPWLEFGYGSGRSRGASNHNDGFVSINTDYRPGGIYGRFSTETAGLPSLGNSVDGMASNGLDNRVIYGLGVKTTPSMAPKLTVGVQAYKYAFARTSDTGVFGNTQFSRDIGTEGDVTAEWKHSPNVSFKVTLGEFMPGAFVNNEKGANAEVNPATLAALDTSIKF
jgi:hypothetical protein